MVTLPQEEHDVGEIEIVLGPKFYTSESNLSSKYSSDPTNLTSKKGLSHHNSLMTGLSYAQKAVSFQAHAKKSSVARMTNDLLPDADDLKKQMIDNLAKRQYDVCNFYKTSGWAQQIARDHRLEQLTLCVVVLNALYLWIDTDYNSNSSLYESGIGFQITENVFCVYFTVELLIRFFAFKLKYDCLRDAWFVFDSILVFIMVLETWIVTYIIRIFGVKITGSSMGNSGVLRLLRLLRLSRMSRMARVLRSVPALLVLVKGLAAASSACMFVALLLILAMYLWALALKQLSNGLMIQEKYFSDIPNAMYNLMMSGCFFVGFEITLDEISTESVVCGILYFCFVVLSGVAIMKMLTGMLCKVINTVATNETEAMTVSMVKDTLVHILLVMGHCEGTGTQDVDTGNMTIEISMFYEMLNEPKALYAFHKIGVDPVGLISSVDFIFPERANGDSPTPKSDRSVTSGAPANQVSFSDFMEKILQLRGSNTATVQDVVEIRKFIRMAFRHVQDQYTRRRVSPLPIVGHVRDFSHDNSIESSNSPRIPRRAEQVFQQYKTLSQAEKGRFMYLLATNVGGFAGGGVIQERSVERETFCTMKDICSM